MSSYRFKDIQLSQLRSFCLVALEGSFTRAAKVLGVSVPAVWDRVRALERKLGVTLLRWHDQTVELTRDGRLVLELVQPHVSGLDALAQLLERRRAELPDQLTVACVQYALDYHLPNLIRAFSKAHPSISLKLIASTTPSTLVRCLEAGEAELGLNIYDRAEPRSPYLEYEDLFDMQLMLFTAVDHPLARKKRVAPADIVAYPLVLTPAGRKRLEAILRKHDLLARMHVALETDSTDTVNKYVALGVGISLGYAHRAAARGMPGVHLRVFDAADRLTMALMVCKGVHLPEPALLFCQSLRVTAEPHATE